jgi:dynein heavy chain 1
MDEAPLDVAVVPASDAGASIQGHLEEFLCAVCPALLDCGDAFKASLQSEASQRVVSHFVADASVRVLFVQSVSSAAADAADLNATPALTYEFREEVSHTEGSMPSVAFLKRHAGPFNEDRSITSQVQAIVLGQGLGAEESGNPALGLLYAYTHFAFAPLLQSMVNQQSDSDDKDRKIGLPAVSKKIKELELSLTQCQFNLEIPEVNLLPFVHPDIKAAAEKVAAGAKIDMDLLGLTPKLADDSFLNTIQNGVGRWTKEIQKVTCLQKEDRNFQSALQEINFWSSLEQALLKTEQRLNSPEIEITLTVLKQAKRFSVTVIFESDHGLKPALEQVNNIMGLMRDFPIDKLLSATTVEQIGGSLEKIFTHLKKIKVTARYTSLLCYHH